MNSQIDATRYETTPVENEHRTILFLDEDPQDRRLHHEALEQVGYSVRTAGDGLEGWDLIQREHFDLIVTDHKLPRMTGLELAQRVRLEGMNQSLIISTDLVTPLLVNNLSFMRFAAILYKPYTMADLFAAVRRALRNVPVDGECRVSSFLLHDLLPGHTTPLPEHWGINE